MSIMINTLLVNICIVSFACVGIGLAVSIFQNVMYDHKQEKREEQRDLRDLEYHKKRMNDFK